PEVLVSSDVRGQAAVHPSREAEQALEPVVLEGGDPRAGCEHRLEKPSAGQHRVNLLAAGGGRALRRRSGSRPAPGSPAWPASAASDRPGRAPATRNARRTRLRSPGVQPASGARSRAGSGGRSSPYTRSPRPTRRRARAATPASATATRRIRPRPRTRRTGCGPARRGPPARDRSFSPVPLIQQNPPPGQPGGGPCHAARDAWSATHETLGGVEEVVERLLEMLGQLEQVLHRLKLALRQLAAIRMPDRDPVVGTGDPG